MYPSGEYRSSFPRGYDSVKSSNRLASERLGVGWSSPPSDRFLHGVLSVFVYFRQLAIMKLSHAPKRRGT